MTRTDAFARDFCNRMKEFRSTVYQWTCAENLSGRGHESVDIVGRPSNKRGKLILLEVELRKDAPLTNIVKVWRWLSNKQSIGRFVFVQAFSRYYKEQGTKRLNAEFVGRQMERATGNKYVSISFSYNPYRHGKQGAGRRRQHARALAETIQRKLNTLV